MEMMMRACDDITMSQDLTPPIPPLAASLHHSFLHSHCSSCFHRLPSNPNPNPNPNPNQSRRSLSCPSCYGSVIYCSPPCLASDSDPHASSGECRFFRNTKGSQPDHVIGNSTDLRVALRLLHLFQRNGPLQLSPRMGGLLVGDLEEVLGEGGEVAGRIKDDALLMSAVRSERRPVTTGAKLEMMVLLAVMRNSVEVQIGEGWSLGVAVYGPHFSWFNHSCAPNAFYRFQLYQHGSCESRRGFQVVPSAMGETATLGEDWNSKEHTMNEEHCVFGPRAVVRSIKPIKEADEVCIAYTDILQPKGLRHGDLWSKYRFTCQCSRCTESPQSYVDFILTCDWRTLNSHKGTITCTNDSLVYEYLSDAVQEAIEEYTSSDNPKLCCNKLENILFQNTLANSLHTRELPVDRFSLHTFHHLSHMAYMTLASAYRLGSQIADNRHSFSLSRISAAYSTLLCFSAYNLFLCEPSLMASTSHLLFNAGEALLNLFGNQKLEHSITSMSQLHTTEGSLPQFEFQVITCQFVQCVSTLLPQCWPFLVQNSLYLGIIKTPIDSSWTVFLNNQPRFSFSKQICVACELKLEKFDEEQKKNIYKLAVHCLIHGLYLANICYGPNCHLIDRAKSLLKC